MGCKTRTNVRLWIMSLFKLVFLDGKLRQYFGVLETAKIQTLAVGVM